MELSMRNHTLSFWLNGRNKGSMNIRPFDGYPWQMAVCLNHDPSITLQDFQVIQDEHCLCCKEGTSRYLRWKSKCREFKHLARWISEEAESLVRANEISIDKGAKELVAYWRECARDNGNGESQLVCNRSHPLVYVSQRERMGTSSGYKFGFTCDHCGNVRGKESAYHCKQCEYDLCDECSRFSGASGQ